MQTMPARPLVWEETTKKKAGVAQWQMQPAASLQLTICPPCRPACLSASRINLEDWETIMISISIKALSANRGPSPQSSASSRAPCR